MRINRLPASKSRRYAGPPNRLPEMVWVMVLVCLLVNLAPVAHAQEPLGLSEAIKFMLANHPLISSQGSAEHAAAQRIRQAQAGRLPSVSYSESIHAGNNPVYVFGSLLEQHRFGAANFALESLNNPDPLVNFSSVFSAEQVVYDGRRTATQIQMADTGLKIKIGRAHV